MDKRALVLVILSLLICAGAGSAFAAGIEKNRATRTVLTLGGTNVTTFPPVQIGGGSPSSLVDRVVLRFPTLLTSPVSRFDWSRWFSGLPQLVPTP